MYMLGPNGKNASGNSAEEKEKKLPKKGGLKGGRKEESP